MPHILLPRYVPGDEISFVAADHEQGARLLTEHLIALGHRRIGFTRRPEVFETDDKRHDGYRRALETAGIRYDESLVIDSDSNDPHNAEKSLDALLDLQDASTAISRFTGGEDPRHLTLAAAASVSATIPIIVVILLFQKHLVKGLAAGAVKG